MIAVLQYTSDVSNILLLTFAGTIMEPSMFVNFCDKPTINRRNLRLKHSQHAFYTQTAWSCR
ncbi:hypothetical protein D0810_05200 [Vibrio cholerae]|uniref:Uncharacterized protein n=1 Tax=Vibrio cholerae TaxID=666 RepID=A0A5C9HNQ3_VIBCL|nr:hypothetical protein [Vibrio cholerae]QHQ91638.1 hypothetical protein FKV26_14060 [Vibrio cholerae O1]EGQ9108447.1 hypothetical protein [Vibrio cholerae]EGQ9189135.1 hypothetical protein [Vibrio cholerae]EGQ9418445.1 hypothetical protein [Vibrio cholerae]